MKTDKSKVSTTTDKNDFVAQIAGNRKHRDLNVKKDGAEIIKKIDDEFVAKFKKIVAEEKELIAKRDELIAKRDELINKVKIK